MTLYETFTRNSRAQMIALMLSEYILIEADYANAEAPPSPNFAETYWWLKREFARLKLAEHKMVTAWMQGEFGPGHWLDRRKA